MKLIPAAGIVGAVALKEAASTEFRQIMELVQAALCVKLGMPKEQCWSICIEAIFADRVIIRRDGRFWAYAYSLGQDNQVQLGDAQEVVEQYVPVALREALAASVFLEAKDAEGAVWEAVLIRAGQAKGEGHTYYSDAVLREAAPLFEGVRVFAKPDDVHLKGGGKDVNSIAGWISGPRFVEGAKTDAGYIAGLVNLTASPLRDTITDAWKRGKRDLVALSIAALGSAFREAKRRVATAITQVHSVDIIVEPGAGGALVRLVEAADSSSKESDDMKLKQRMLDTIKARKPELVAKLSDASTDEEIEAAYREAVAAPDAAGGVTKAQMDETVRMVEARAYARHAIAGAKLPQAAKDKLLADYGKRERFVAADVDAAINGEREYLAKFTESGKVIIDGEIQVEDRSTKIAGMLDAFFDPSHKDHRSAQSFRECYIEMTGDTRVTGLLANMDRTRLAESLGAVYRESLDSASFAAVLGDSITRRMVADYRDKSQYDGWRQIANVVPVTDFRTQERALYGGYGDLPAVAQGGAYLALGSPTDAKATYAASKRGGTEDITLEMIKNDDVGAIRRIPVKLSRSAKRTLAKFVFDFIRNNPVVYDGVALFHAAHNNLGAAALSATTVGAGRTAMLKQPELSSAEPMGIGPKSILVPVDLQEATWNLFQRGTNLDKTFVQSMLLDIIPVWYWTDTNDWAMAADPLDIPGIEVGFLDGQEEPELFVQDMPNVGSMFSNDKVTYKIRHIYGGNVVAGGEKAFYKAVVA